MSNNKYNMLIITILFIFFCTKKNPTESNKNVSSVKILEITCEKPTITNQDTVKFECVATASDSLHYHWEGITNITDRENTSSSFDFGKWIKWSPPDSGGYAIEVLAYLRAGNGTGSSKCYYEYHTNGQIKSIYCFYESEKGETWDIKSIGIDVENVELIKFNWSLQAAEAGYGIYSSPAIGQNGTIYIGSSDGYLYAINPDGTEKWYYLINYIQFNNESSPAIDPNGTIYIGGADQKLYAINMDGTKKWEYQFSNDYIYIGSSPAIGSDGTIYVGSKDHHLYAVNSNGTRKWAYKTGGCIDSSPAIGSDGIIYIGSWDDHLYAINPDGTKKWEYQITDMTKSSPAIGSDETIYIGSGDVVLYAINPDGTKKWECEIASWGIESSPSIGPDGTIYIGGGDGYLYAIQSDGNLKWKCKTEEVITSSPAIDAEGTIYIGSSNRELYANSKNYKFYAISPDGGIKWKYKTDDPINSSPVISPDGMVYIGSDNGKLYAFTGKCGPADSPWPMYRHDSRHTGRKIE